MIAPPLSASSLAVLLLAANIYSKQTADADANYMSRISLYYVNEKIHQNDKDGGVSIQSLEGQDCLYSRPDRQKKNGTSLPQLHPW